MKTHAQAQAELSEKTQRSQQIAQDRAEVLNSGLAANLEMPHPVFIERGAGAFVFDADGKDGFDLKSLAFCKGAIYCGAH